jgi:AraC-like DNA-binding protein
MIEPSSRTEGDPVSDVLGLLRARASVSATLRAGGSWSLAFPPPEGIKFNAIVRGQCWLLAAGASEVVRLVAGDCFLMIEPQAYVLTSDPGLVPIEASAVFSRLIDGAADVGDGDDVLIIGGRMTLAPENATLLLQGIPPALHLRGDHPEAEAFRWSLTRLSVELQTPMPGGRLLADHLAQIMMILLLRFHMGSAGAMQHGWLRGLRDPRIGAALRLMHGAPARKWTVGELASNVAMSRSNFSAAFTRLVGRPPLSYLADWRIRIAADMLRAGERNLAGIAARTGYGSESAFGNAFKRASGVSPIRYGLDFAETDRRTNDVPWHAGEPDPKSRSSAR